VESSGGTGRTAFDAVVEAVRQTALAPQVSGTVVEISVRPGDRVRAGQVLVRLDGRAASQGAASSAAQVDAARAALDVARQDFERQQRLFSQGYISQAALERAQAQFKATSAQLQAQIAQADAARTQVDFYVLAAPYAGLVAEVPANLGDMAMPGHALLTVYDPGALRLTAMVPQSAAPLPAQFAVVQAEVPGSGSGAARITPTRVQVLPTVDPGTHAVEVRLDLPRGLKDVAPGMFARAWLPARDTDAGGAATSDHFFVPRRAVLQRGEVTAVYVLDAQGRPQLRQVRTGDAAGSRVEVLSGLGPDDRVALDPLEAARRR
jgi:membrane fusion protein, multidrug efflux system